MHIIPQMGKFINAVLGISALLTLVYICLGQTRLGLVGTLDESLSNSYVLYFFPDKIPKSTEEEAKLKEQLTDLVDSYSTYVEKTLGSVVKHRYDTVLHGLAIQLRNSEELTNAFWGESISLDKISAQNVLDVFYKLRQQDLEQWKIRLNVEKDAPVNVQSNA